MAIGIKETNKNMGIDQLNIIKTHLSHIPPCIYLRCLFYVTCVTTRAWNNAGCHFFATAILALTLIRLSFFRVYKIHVQMLVKLINIYIMFLFCYCYHQALLSLGYLCSSDIFALINYVGFATWVNNAY